MWKEDLQNMKVMIKRCKMFTGKAPLTLVMKKKIGSRSMALQIEAKVKNYQKSKRDVRRW